MSKKSPPETPLYVKLPAPAGERLDRASEALGMSKKELVTSLVTKYLGPAPGAQLGSYSFQPYDGAAPAPEVLSVEQAARFLQIEEALVVELAERGKLPGRKLGTTWRFARAALIAWLSAAEPR